MLVEMPSDEVAIRLSTRSILLRSVYEYWAQGALLVLPEIASKR